MRSGSYEACCVGDGQVEHVLTGIYLCVSSQLLTQVPRSPAELLARWFSPPADLTDVVRATNRLTHHIRLQGIIAPRPTCDK